MSYFKSTSEIRSEVKDGYAYIRNINGEGVIDALLNEKQMKKVTDIIQSVTSENFSKVWDMVNSIKGVRFDYRSN